MQITTMDKASVKYIASLVEKRMQELADELGLNVVYKGGTYESTAGTFLTKCQFELEGAGRAAFERDVRSLCYTDPWLTDEDYNREFVSNGKTFAITGINLRAPKYPIKATCLNDNRNYKFPESTVKRALGRV